VAAGCEQISQADAALTNAFELIKRRTMIAETAGRRPLGMTSSNTKLSACHAFELQHDPQRKPPNRPSLLRFSPNVFEPAWRERGVARRRID
jgi:hypothetical protein